MPMFPSSTGFMPIKRPEVPDYSAAAYRDNVAQRDYERQKWDQQKALIQEGASLGKGGFDAYSAWKGRKAKAPLESGGVSPDRLSDALMRNRDGVNPAQAFGSAGSAVGKTMLGGLEEGVDGLGDPQAATGGSPEYRKAHDQWRGQVKQQEEGVDTALGLIGMTNPYAMAITSILRMLT